MSKHKNITLEAVYNDWAENGGVFTDLENLFPNDLPWKEQITGIELDYSYYGNHSGAKIVSPLIRKILTTEGLSEAKRNTLATIIWHKYGINWTSLWETMFYEYDPISNYDRTEHRETKFGKTEDRAKTGSETDKHTGTDTNTKSGKETLTKSGSEAKSHTGTIGDSGSESTQYGKKEEIDSDRVLVNDKNAFNSASWVNDTRTTESGGPTTQLSGTDTTQNGNTRTFNDTETETYTNRKDEREFANYQEQETKNLTDEHTYNVKDAYEEGGTEEEDARIKGNIGVTTSQQMIEQERALWDWSFFERVFEDVDKVLTIGAFGCSDELDIDYIELRLPIASTTKLGCIKVGANLTIEEDGTLNAQPGGGGGGAVDDVRVNGTSVVRNGIAYVITPTKTSDLQNDSGFVNAQQAANVAPVQSVNGQTGAITGLALQSTVDAEISALQDIVDGNTDDISDLRTDLSGKVDKETGKGLSTNDFTTAEKNKLAGIEAGAQVNVQADWNETDSSADDYIKNKPTIPSPYTLPIASASDLGGVKIGSGINIAADGTISVSGSGGGGTTVHTIDIASRVLNSGDYTQQLVNFTVDTSTEKVKRILVALTVNLMYGGGLYFVLSNRANMYVGDINVSDLSFTTNYGLRSSYWDISQFTAEGHGFQVGGYSADMTSGYSTVYDGPTYIDTTGTNIRTSDGYYSIQMAVRNAPGGTTVYGKVIYETEAI